MAKRLTYTLIRETIQKLTIIIRCLILIAVVVTILTIIIIWILRIRMK